jgi:WD40 repeat protein
MRRAVLGFAAAALALAVVVYVSPDQVPPIAAPAGSPGGPPGEPEAAKATALPDLVLQAGHEYRDWVLATAFSPDARLLASSGSSAIKLWDVATGRELRTLDLERDARAYSLAFSPDGRWLASGSSDGRVRLWDARTGRPRHVLGRGGPTVFSVAFSRDGRWLASAGSTAPSTRGTLDTATLKLWLPSTIKLWNVSTAQETHVLKGPVGFVRALAFSPDDRWLASAGEDGTVKLWEVATGRELHTLRGHGDAVTGVAFSPDGQTLASAGSGYDIILRDVATGRELRRLKAQYVGTYGSAVSVVITDVAFSADGRRLIAAGREHVSVFDVATGGVLRATGNRDNHTPVGPVTFSSDGRWLAARRADSDSSDTVTMWSVDPLRHVRNYARQTGAIERIVFSRDGRWLATGEDDLTVSPDRRQFKAIRLWEAASGRLHRTVRHRTEPFRYDWGFNLEARLVAFGAYTWRKETLVPVSDMDVPKWRPRRTAGVDADKIEFSPDGRWLASVDEKGALKLWDLAHEHLEPRTLGLHEIVRSNLAFSPDGRWLASGGREIRLWDLAPGGSFREDDAASDGSDRRRREPVHRVCVQPGQRQECRRRPDRDRRRESQASRHGLHPGGRRQRVRQPPLQPEICRGRRADVQRRAAAPAEGSRGVRPGGGRSAVRPGSDEGQRAVGVEAVGRRRSGARGRPEGDSSSAASPARGYGDRLFRRARNGRRAEVLSDSP